MKQVWQLMRPGHYTKNLFVYLPLLISGRLFDIEKLQFATVTFFAFSFLSSSVYIFNDWRDQREDQKHPVKKNRPLALGSISVQNALLLSLSLAIISLSLIAPLEFRVVFLFVLYLLLNLGYSLGFKKIAILDVLILAAGIVLRFIAGGWAVNVAVESWFVILTFIMALMMAIGKRLDDAGEITHENTDDAIYSQYGYNTRILEALLLLSSGLFLSAYLMFCMDEKMTILFETNRLFFSFAIVVTGSFRYLQLVLFYRRSGYGGRHFLKDKFLLLTLVIWISFFAGLAALKTFFPQYSWILL